MALKLVTAPAMEPMSLDEAKTYLRVEHNDEDEFIAGLIVAARQAAELLHPSVRSSNRLPRPENSTPRYRQTG